MVHCISQSLVHNQCIAMCKNQAAIGHYTARGEQGWEATAYVPHPIPRPLVSRYQRNPMIGQPEATRRLLMSEVDMPIAICDNCTKLHWQGGEAALVGWRTGAL